MGLRGLRDDTPHSTDSNRSCARRRGFHRTPNGDYDIVVARCREAVESVQAALDDGESTEGAMTLYRKDKASRESMSLLQREQVILETVRHYANLAHHVDNKGSAGRHGRADATFLLAPATSAVTRACARARIVSPGAGE
jgi:cation transport regulator ChaC